jgi:predicted DCC family thiol-disulfide oxidoreductase YuxK
VIEPVLLELRLAAEPPTIYFDGVCNLCNGTVNFVIDRDRTGSLRFSSLQSDSGRRLLGLLGQGERSEAPDSILFVENGRVYDRSTAALRIARHLSGWWPLLGVLLLLPVTLRDRAYRWVASKRYRWFGKLDACRAPSQERRSRFIE